MISNPMQRSVDLMPTVIRRSTPSTFTISWGRMIETNLVWKIVSWWWGSTILTMVALSVIASSWNSFFLATTSSWDQTSARGRHTKLISKTARSYTLQLKLPWLITSKERSTSILNWKCSSRLCTGHLTGTLKLLSIWSIVSVREPLVISTSMVSATKTASMPQMMSLSQLLEGLRVVAMDKSIVMSLLVQLTPSS